MVYKKFNTIFQMFSSNAVFIPKCTRTTLTKDFFAMNFFRRVFAFSIVTMLSTFKPEMELLVCDNETVLTTRFSAIIGHFYLINVF